MKIQQQSQEIEQTGEPIVLCRERERESELDRPLFFLSDKVASRSTQRGFLAGIKLHF